MLPILKDKKEKVENSAFRLTFCVVILSKLFNFVKPVKEKYKGWPGGSGG